MRLAAIASALAIVLCVAVFGAIFLQKASIPAPASSPATVTTEPGARPSVGVACAGAGADAGAGMEAFCKKMAPNTATHSTIASADAIAARRMSDLQTP